jgi:hypothetical protein
MVGGLCIDIKYNIQLIYYCIISPTNPLKHKRVEIFTRYQDTGNFVQIIIDYNNDNYFVFQRQIIKLVLGDNSLFFFNHPLINRLLNIF